MKTKTVLAIGAAAIGGLAGYLPFELYCRHLNKKADKLANEVANNKETLDRMIKETNDAIFEQAQVVPSLFK